MRRIGDCGSARNSQVTPAEKVSRSPRLVSIIEKRLIRVIRASRGNATGAIRRTVTTSAVTVRGGVALLSAGSLYNNVLHRLISKALGVRASAVRRPKRCHNKVCPKAACVRHLAQPQKSVTACSIKREQSASSCESFAPRGAKAAQASDEIR
mmetsp:Transcript_58284/g.138874  ORF Transcript_58284/g.138874 Transcript_58284/m.138874 type:complete len:153 (+) Transcript_58284:299-757(+)